MAMKTQDKLAAARGQFVQKEIEIELTPRERTMAIERFLGEGTDHTSRRNLVRACGNRKDAVRWLRNFAQNDFPPQRLGDLAVRGVLHGLIVPAVSDQIIPWDEVID